jgi:hypothetical protein
LYGHEPRPQFARDQRPVVAILVHLQAK